MRTCRLVPAAGGMVTDVSVRLESWYIPADDGAGWFRLRLVNAGPDEVTGFQLCFQSVVQMTPVDSFVTLVARQSGHHVIAAPSVVLAPGGTWEIGLLACGHRPGHANDGPVGAYVVLADQSTRAVRTAPTARAPFVAVGEIPASLVLAAGAGDDVRAAVAMAAACEQRLVGDGRGVLDGPGDGTPLHVDLDDALGPEAFVVTERESGLALRAGATGLPLALLALARRHRSGGEVGGEHRPRWSWRGLHVDLARQFFPGDDVLQLIDVAAWHGLNRLHLHLTDDEAWRIPIDDYPALTDIGAFRGHGLPIPPLLGSGADAYGGSYRPTDIAAWVARGRELGVELVPEIDLPAHSFAARAALAELGDPGDTTSARTVQHFTANVLDPGLTATWRFLEAVFGSVADLFPGRWLHVGGDEVPSGAWSGSPAAARWAADRGLPWTAAIAAEFIGDIVGLARSTTSRTIGVWQEAADGGGVAPGDAYVVGWRTAADCRRLAAAGHDVVAAPADAYYLDMAASEDWDEPGTSWAGHTSLAEIESFDPVAGWSDIEQTRLLGVQAAIWTEHAPDRPTLERLLHPRLAAFARSAWTTAP